LVEDSFDDEEEDVDTDGDGDGDDDDDDDDDSFLIKKSRLISHIVNAHTQNRIRLFKKQVEKIREDTSVLPYF